jgi:hypothetical protein
MNLVVAECGFEPNACRSPRGVRVMKMMGAAVAEAEWKVDCTVHYQGTKQDFSLI